MTTTASTNTYTFKVEIPSFEIKVDVPHKDFAIEAFADELAMTLTPQNLDHAVFQAYLSSNGPHDAELNAARTGELPEAIVTCVSVEAADGIDAFNAEEKAAA